MKFFAHQDDLRTYFGSPSACDDESEEDRHNGGGRWVVQRRMSPLVIPLTPELMPTKRSRYRDESDDDEDADQSNGKDYGDVVGAAAAAASAASGWDIRAYLLVASTEPLLAFYHSGYARSSRYDADSERFVLDEFALTLPELQRLFDSHKLSGAHFVEAGLETYAKRAMRMLVHAALPRLRPAHRSFQLFEVNIIMDSTYHLWLVGANEMPGFSAASGFRNVRATMVDAMKSLVLEAADVPEAFAGMRYGDSYSGFRLVYSAYEEEATNSTYKPCKELGKKWAVSKTAMTRAAEIHNAVVRHHAANERELRKYVRSKWAGCREKFSAQTCQTSTFNFVAKRYRMFLEKERKPIDEGDVQRWAKNRVLELSGANATAHGGEAALAAARARAAAHRKK